MRLNKFIASCGIASRRKADFLITAGRVEINGLVVDQLGTTVDPKKDTILVNGKPCKLADEHTYLILNKPKGYICTHARFDNQQSIFKLLPKEYHQLKIAGRLDKDSEGLVLLSDDGDFIQQVTHPSFKQEKEYEITLHHELSPSEIQLLKRGVRIKEGVARADSLRHIKGTTYSIVLHQGWKRQIRRMLDKVANAAISLVRVREGKVTMKGVASGKYIKILRDEVL